MSIEWRNIEDSPRPIGPPAQLRFHLRTSVTVTLQGINVILETGRIHVVMQRLLDNMTILEPGK